MTTTNFVTEAKRLGIPAPWGADFALDGDFIVPWPGRYTERLREDRLCVDGCDDCRAFRQQVQNALNVEAQTAIALQESFDRMVEEAYANSRHAIAVFDDLTELVGSIPVGGSKAIDDALSAIALARSLTHDVLCPTDGEVGTFIYDEAERTGATVNVPAQPEQSTEELQSILDQLFGGTPFSFEDELDEVSF